MQPSISEPTAINKARSYVIGPITPAEQGLVEFLKRVLPAEHEDRYYIFDTKGPKQKGQTPNVCDKIENMAKRILKDDARLEVWFSAAAYDRKLVWDHQTKHGVERGRLGKYVVALKALRQDIDIHASGCKDGAADGKPCHTSIEAAIEARDAILTKLGLSASITVRSGGGLHSYIIADREMAPAEFKAASVALRDVIEKADPRLAVDTSRWCDVNGLLRPPFTFNKKASRRRPFC